MHKAQWPRGEGALSSGLLLHLGRWSNACH